MTARAHLAALATGGRRWTARLATLFALWAIGRELWEGAGFIAAVASAPGAVLLVLAGLAAILSAAAAAAEARPVAGRLGRTFALAGAGLLLLSPPLSLRLRETRMLKVGDGHELPAGELPGLPALRVGEITVAPTGAFPGLSKSVEVPLETEDGETARVGLFPPARLGGWRLTVFQFGYAPSLEWRDAAGREIAAGFMMLGTFPRTEEEARLVDWLPEPNVMMGVGTFPPKVEDLVSPPGRLHLHVRLQSAEIAGARRTLASPDGYRFAMDGRPRDPALYLQVFDGGARRFEGVVRAGQRVRYDGGELGVGPDVALWAELQAVRDPFVELFLAGGALVAAGAVAGAVALVGRAGAGRSRRDARLPPS